MSSPTIPWTEAEVLADALGKKEILQWLLDNASFSFLGERKMKGAIKNVAKSKSKDDAVKAYLELLQCKEFRQEGEVDESKKAAATDIDKVAAETEKLTLATEDEVPKYKKIIIKKGNKLNFPARGDLVKVYYTGTLEDGTVFDTNIHPQRRGKIQPLAFKVGKGLVIKGWDEALLTMSLGEKAKIVIEPEWAYGRRGNEKIPGNATLTFEVELMAIN